jgi:hypothetical protein
MNKNIYTYYFFYLSIAYYKFIEYRVCYIEFFILNIRLNFIIIAFKASYLHKIFHILKQ